MGKDKSTYAAFIEKMFAKAMGNYEIIIGGNSGEANAFLSGAPSDSFDYTQKAFTGQEIWPKINDANDKKYIMEASTSSAPGGDKSANSFGIAYGHSYSLIGACVIKDNAGTVLDRVIKIRNPWGVDSFN